MEGIETNQIVQGGLFLSALTYVGYLLKGAPQWIWNRIHTRIIYRVNIDELDDLYYYFERWLRHNYNEKYRNVEASLEFIKSDANANVERIKSGIVDNNAREINYKQYEDFIKIKYKGKRIYINKGREKFENAANIRNAFFSRFNISAVFGRKQIEALLEEVLQFNLQLEENNKKINIYTSSRWGDWVHVQNLNAKDIEHIIIDDKDKKDLIEDLIEFEKSEEWYKERSISYKRGYMFSGAPGNGKTSLILSIAKFLKRDVYFLNSDIEDNASLNNAMRNLKPNAILALEDADCMFVKRIPENKSEDKEIPAPSNGASGRVTLSALLNCIDGSLSKENIITILTSNHPEKLDPALIRVGRIDKKYNISNPNKELIERYLGIFYNRPVQLPFKVIDNHHLSMSAVQDFCIMNKTDISQALIKLEQGMYGLKPGE